jgi:hypothetical protein
VVVIGLVTLKSFAYTVDSGVIPGVNAGVICLQSLNQ